MSILSLPDELLLLVMEKLALATDTMSVLRGLASARRRFQRVAYGDHSTLFEEPVFARVSSPSAPMNRRNEPYVCADHSTLFEEIGFGRLASLRDAYAAHDQEEGGASQVAREVVRLAAKFGERIERLDVGGVHFGAAVGGEPARSPLVEVLCACPNLTHLSLAPAASEFNTASARPISLVGLPDGFALPRLRHLDLSGLALPLPALHRLLAACAPSLQRLFLRGSREARGDGFPWDVLRNAEDTSGTLFIAADISGPRESVAAALDGLRFPRLESVDLACRGVSPLEARRLLRALPALRDLYLLAPERRGFALWGVEQAPALQWEEVFAEEASSPRRLCIRTPLRDMDAASLRALRAHFDGTAYPRPPESCLDVPRLALPAFFEALSMGASGVEDARKLVSALGLSPLARPQAHPTGRDPWVPPYFRPTAGGARAVQKTALELLVSAHACTPAHAYERRAPVDASTVRELIGEWGLAPLLNGGSVLQLAATHHPALIDMLVEAGADPALQDARGAPALLAACKAGQEEAVRALLKLGADPHCTDTDGSTLLHVVCKQGLVSLAQALVEAGADPSSLQDARGAAALLAACKDGREDAVRALLKFGADPLSRDAAGATPLHVACELGLLKAARAVLEAAGGAGVDALSARDAAGRTPLQRLAGSHSRPAPAPAPALEPEDDLDEPHAPLWNGLWRDPEQTPLEQNRIDREQRVRHSQSLIALHVFGLRLFSSGPLVSPPLEGPQLEALGVRRAFLEEAVWGGEGNEPLLHFAVREATSSVVRALLRAGADPCQQDGARGGVTALRVAEAGQHAELARAIRAFAKERGIPLEHLRGAAGP
eukprot:tig00000144_g9078.t1